MENNINVSWDTHSSHVMEMMNGLLTAETSKDVVLVCDDQIKLRAHQFVLKAFSPVFESILSDSAPVGNPLIYLRGVNHIEMEALLNFIYMGETTLPQDRMSEFLNLGQEFQIKDVNQFQMQTSAESPETANLESDTELTDETVDDLFTFDEEEDTKAEVVHAQNSLDGPKSKVTTKCNECDYQASSYPNLKRHQRVVHEKVRYPCNQCNFQAKHRYYLKEHIQSKHGDSKYLCSLCDYTTSWKENLANHHKKNKHIYN